MREGRVLIVSDYIGGEGAASGGAGHAAYDSYRALQGAGIDVRMVAGFGSAPGGPGDRFTSLGGTDLRAGGMLATGRAVYNPSARRALADELAKEDPDTTVVILHQWTRYLSPSSLGLLEAFPTMIYMHDYFWACPTGAYYDFRQARPCDRAPMGMRCLAANCDRAGRVQKAGRVFRHAVRQFSLRAGSDRRVFLHLSTGAMLTAAPLLPNERHAIIYNPLELERNAPSPPPAQRYDIGYFGRLEPEKGVGDLIETADRLGLTGLFAGEGSLETEVMRRPALEHRRWAPRASMPATMRSCSIVVLPSLWHETWGLIVPEAMAAGVKVLVSVRAGSAELVQRYGGGATFDPGRPGDLARTVSLLLGPAPRPLDWGSLRRALSPGEHAGRIVALARERFDIALGSAAAALTAAPASSPRVSMPA